MLVQRRARLAQSQVDAEYRQAGILVNLDGRVPIDEASACYKPSREVVSAVVKAGLARIEHELWPLSSLKGTDERGGKRGKKNRDPRDTKTRRKRDDVTAKELDAELNTDYSADTDSDDGGDTSDGNHY